MKRNLIITFALAFVTALVAAGSALAKDNPGPLTGTWSCQAKGGSQGDTPFTLYLQQNGENVDGSVSSPMGSTEFSSATFKGDTLEIHIDSPDGDYILTAKLDKDTLSSGTWAHGDDKGTWEGKKQPAGSQ
ncbi:MAG: hypothetical protein ACLQVL_10985 [Terriglobia bacterium]